MRKIVIGLFMSVCAASLPAPAKAAIASPATVKRAAECLTKSPQIAEVFSETFGPTSFTGHFYGLKAVSVSASGGCSKVAPITDQGLLTAVGMGSTSSHMLMELELTNGTHVFALQ